MKRLLELIKRGFKKSNFLTETYERNGAKDVKSICYPIINADFLGKKL